MSNNPTQTLNIHLMGQLFTAITSQNIPSQTSLLYNNDQSQIARSSEEPSRDKKVITHPMLQQLP